jgi:L-ascorbate metabolism protein UlaG (beta-lactamase superfamily)
MEAWMNFRVRFVVVLVVWCTVVSAWADSQSWRYAENNQRLIDAQKTGGDPSKPGPVTITYYGHMAFKITSPAGLEILIDPWRNDPSGTWGLWFHDEFPGIAVDAVLSTHAHFDHDAVYRPHAVMVLERMSGELLLGDVKITGLADKHVCVSKGWYKWHEAAAEFSQEFCPPGNPLHMDNFIQVIETGGLKIVHWGDNRPVPAEHVEAALAGVDILILPIDASAHLLDSADVNAAVRRYEPGIVIPAHYKMQGANSVMTTLGSADEWVGTQANVTRARSAVLKLDTAALKGAVRRVHYFGDHYAKD